MYKDLHRIEDALLPCLFRHASVCHIEECPEVADYYKDALEILDETIQRCFSGLTVKHNIALIRRLSRAIHKVNEYFVKNKFTTRKMFLTLSEWIKALLEGEAITYDETDRIWIYLHDLGEIIINHGYGEIENFAKIDESAINHVPKVHAIAQQQGYYL